MTILKMFGVVYLCNETNLKLQDPILDLWARGNRRNLSSKQSGSSNMTFPNTVFSCFHCFSAFFCLFFSPLTLAQLKTELLGSKFNSILEETTVRFLNKSPLKAQASVTDASPRISASVSCTLPFVSRTAFCMAASLLTQTARLTGNISVSLSVCPPVTINIFSLWCLVTLFCHLRCHRHLASDMCHSSVPLSAGRRRGLSTCGLFGRTGEARAELRCSGVYRGQVQGGGLREGGWRQQLHRNQSQMNRDPSLIPRLCETQW